MTFCSARVSAGPISYRIRLRDPPFRALFLSRSRSPSPASLPSWRWFYPLTVALSKEAAGKKTRKFLYRANTLRNQARRSSTRLQGFTPHESPSPLVGGLDQPGHVALLSLLPSRVFPLVGMDAALHRVSPHVVQYRNPTLIHKHR